MTKLLLPVLEKSQPATIVSVSSNGHFVSYPDGILSNFTAMNNPELYDPMLAYGQSKLANVLFAKELATRLRMEKKKIFVNSLNPGGVNTDLLRHWPEQFVDALQFLFEKFPNKIFYESDFAALTQVYLSIGRPILEKEISGKYFVPVGEECGTSHHGKNIKLQRALWKLSEEVLREKGYN